MFEEQKNVYFLTLSKLITYFGSTSGCLESKNSNTKLFEIYINIWHAFDTRLEFRTFGSLNAQQQRNSLEKKTTTWCGLSGFYFGTSIHIKQVGNYYTKKTGPY